jgi:hypothetical protein
MTEISRVGAVASLQGATEDNLDVGIEWFADLADGRRVLTDERHGSLRVSMWRRGVGAIFRRYHGPPLATTDELDATYRVGVTDIEDAVRETGHLLTLRERWTTLGSPVAFLQSQVGVHGWRAHRWRALRRALEEQGISASRRQLDRLPFSIEIVDELRRELAPRPL